MTVKIEPTCTINKERDRKSRKEVKEKTCILKRVKRQIFKVARCTEKILMSLRYKIHTHRHVCNYLNVSREGDAFLLTEEVKSSTRWSYIHWWGNIAPSKSNASGKNEIKASQWLPRETERERERWRERLPGWVGVTRVKSFVRIKRGKVWQEKEKERERQVKANLLDKVNWMFFE